MTQFQHIEHLLLLLLVPVFILLYRLLLFWKKRTIAKIGDASLVQELIKQFSPRKNALRFSLVLFSLAMLILGVANLQASGETGNANKAGIDIVIALDVSKSMLAQDIQPSRLDKAKLLVARLLDNAGSNRVGLVLFAGRAYMQMPLTNDLSAARLYVSSAGPDAVAAQGTVIAEALSVSEGAFSRKEKKYKAVILITDGEDHRKEIAKTVKGISENGVVLFTVGVGSTQGASFVSNGRTHVDKAGNTVISRLNEQQLIEMANMTQGTYTQLNDVESSLKHLLEELDKMDKKPILDRNFMQFASYFQWFLALAFVGLTGEILVSEKRKHKI